jgi:glycosyltransferase involved in cell wall biosynthesis
MSDVMPYLSSQYSTLSAEQVELYLEAFRQAVKKVISTFKPDLLHIHHLWILTDLLRLVPGVPSVVTVHGTDLKQANSSKLHRAIVERNVHRLAHFFCVSKDMARDAQQLYEIPGQKISILGNGYNPQVFKLSGPRKTSSKRIVLCVGKFVGWKGFRFAIRACARLRVNHQMVILGTGTAEECEKLKTEAAEAKADVLFPGHVGAQEVAAWMRRADVFLLTSIHEPFGLVLLEAMACGCRVVASGSGGPKDVIVPSLLASGHAEFVGPLREDLVGDELRYVSDFTEATERQLGKGTSSGDRKIVADSVAHMTWQEVYTAMRKTYVHACKGK